MYSVFGMGNPLMDILVHDQHAKLKLLGAVPGSMNLVDAVFQDKVLSGGKIIARSPGGSCANTLRGFAWLQKIAKSDKKPVYCGAVGKDAVGALLHESLTDQGVEPSLAYKTTPTGTSVIVVTPDSERTMFTHLGNGCPMQLHRHDNIVQRVLSLHESLWITFIADGAHIEFFTLGNYLSAAGVDRCVVVTDAVAPAGLGPGQYNILGRWNVQVGLDMVARAPDGSHLVGAAVTMKRSLANLVEKVGLSQEDALQLTCRNPRKAIGLSGD